MIMNDEMCDSGLVVSMKGGPVGGREHWSQVVWIKINNSIQKLDIHSCHSVEHDGLVLDKVYYLIWMSAFGTPGIVTCNITIVGRDHTLFNSSF